MHRASVVTGDRQGAVVSVRNGASAKSTVLTSSLHRVSLRGVGAWRSLLDRCTEEALKVAVIADDLAAVVYAQDGNRRSGGEATIVR